MKIAVLGGSGFVGTRLLEKWLLNGSYQPHLVVSGPRSLARVARFPLPSWEQADIFDPHNLADAIRGCDAMVHAIVGNPQQITAAAAAAVEACRIAGVPRLVYLSSASVHGQSPPSGTNDHSRLRDDQPISYNNAKVRAERALLQKTTEVEVCILRPGIVYGPRCQWFSSLPNALSTRQAFLVDGGYGICNHIYVDNLIQAIELGITHPGAPNGAFYVADDIALTWRDFYRPIAKALDFDIDDFVELAAAPLPKKSLSDKILWLKRLRITQEVLPRLSPRLKSAVKAGLKQYATPPFSGGFALPGRATPIADWEISQLHTCTTRLPMDRAQEELGYKPSICADEGLERSARWLASLWTHLGDRDIR
jgi:nucleoside-diphosphate-sugar epimerase